MNYIGSKLSLLNFLENSIQELLNINNDKRNLDILTLADLFAGTGIVGYFFKSKGCKIISNDIQYYSYVLNKNIIENNKNLYFEGLLSEIPQLKNIEDKSNYILKHLENIEGIEGFIFENYSENGKGERLYYSEYNGKKCDAIRIQIENWYKKEKINVREYFFLKSCLINSIDKVANTASVYGAFLKNIKKSAKEKLELREYLKIIDNEKNNIVYNKDVNELIKEIEGDILYLDPPYNQRQYASNYHLLETIAKYDNPLIKGKTGLRDYSEQKSLYCLKKEALETFENLIENSKFKYIILSYNDEGIISIEDIKRIFQKKGKYICFEKEYKRFKADKDENRNHLKNNTIEYLHCLICN